MSVVTTTGGLLPRDLLDRVATHDAKLDGTTPDSYGLAPGEQLSNSITHSWNRVGTLWERFNTELATLNDSERAIGLTRRRLTLPLLAELGFVDLSPPVGLHLDGQDYPISHEWAGSVPVHLVGARVEIDRRTPGVAGAARVSPHGLVQEFLNRSDKHLWAIVSNGRRLRLLRDNASLTRHAYVEFDLAAMLDGEQYSDFRLLWLTCHRTRFEGERPESCLLERWTQEAASSGVRALDRQRVGVERALTALGEGFIGQPNPGLKRRLRSGELSTEDYHRQVLRVIYRLLFLLVAESRDLLLTPAADAAARKRYERFYSAGRLVTLADRQRGSPHSDLWEGFGVVVRALSGMALAPSLELQPLGSFLWSPEATPDLNDATIDNTHFLEAVRALAWVYDEGSRVRRPIDYRNLGAEELGSVYESLLELGAEIDLDGSRFRLVTVAGNERKTTGSYYTPAPLISRLLDEALDPVLDEAEQAAEPADALLALRILDPACGSGHFLIAAAHRIAGRLASVRSGDAEPSPEDLRQALRDVIGRCLHGIDVNPMAVELCKVSLWLEANLPGHPLGFLDHHIVVGNSLLGTTPELLDAGVPDAAFKPLTGDDKEWVKALRKTNKAERKERERAQTVMDLGWSPADAVAALARDVAVIDAGPEESVDDIDVKADLFSDMQLSSEYVRLKLAADAWCAAFVAPKTPEDSPITDSTVRAINERRNIDSRARGAVHELAEQYKFLHLHLAFPDVFARADGFDAVLGNPPWDRVKLLEREFFAARDPAVADASTSAVRKRLIEELKAGDPVLHREFLVALRQAESRSAFLRLSGRYPLCGRGDVNTYSVFAELMRNAISPIGRAGMIVQSGIATDDTTKHFFSDLVQQRSLVSLYDFENRRGVFPAVDSRMKFCLLTCSGADRPVDDAAFVFFAHEVADLDDPDRRFTLTAEDFERINPNTRTCPIFRTQRDATITRAIYRRVPILIREDDPQGNSWGISFQAMFHMANDSHLFREQEDLESEGYVLLGNHFVLPECEGGQRLHVEQGNPRDDRYLPLYEGKMATFYDHRAADVVKSPTAAQRQRQPRYLTADEKQSATRLALPLDWVNETHVRDRSGVHRGWLLGLNNLTSATNERTTVCTALPVTAVGHSEPLIRTSAAPHLLLALLNSFVVDYIARQKVGGTNMTYSYVKQFPILPPRLVRPHTHLIDSIVLELVYTAWDMAGFADDIGHAGPPLCWDDERRSLLRAELDGLMFHLYGISRDDTDYIMETFTTLKRKDEKNRGEYRTKRLILDRYDAMTESYGATHGTFDNTPNGQNPPVDQQALASYSTRLAEALQANYRTNIDPPPAHPSCAHAESTRPSWAN
ncbi:MAG: N-6 DNA methylase [Gemmatimonadetes bacterium]|nr:N-6 DNA methylase [Gemmatimonadota bacterium]